jgi:hypothetical protein
MRAEQWLYTIPLRLRSLFHWARADRQLDDELRRPPGLDHFNAYSQCIVAVALAPARTLAM